MLSLTGSSLGPSKKVCDSEVCSDNLATTPSCLSLTAFTLRLLQPSCSPSLVVAFGEFLDGLATTGGVVLVTRRGKLWGDPESYLCRNAGRKQSNWNHVQELLVFLKKWQKYSL